jgi:hypothetical protein
LLPDEAPSSWLASDRDGWLLVEKVRAGAPGGWGTGTFDKQRNKIDIQTQDVQQFAIYVGRIPINWRRLVIIGIDGVNSELRKRDQYIYHFARDDHDRWIVLEP